MADFTTIKMRCNHGTQAVPVWVDIGGAGTGVRWSDSDAQKDILDTAWPAMIRPAATAAVSYTYAYTAIAVGNGFISNAGVNPCPAFTKANFHWARWNWDALGTFASAPIFTAYGDTNHNTPAARDGAPVILGGSADTNGGGNHRSYLKANAYGQLVSVAAPVAAPANAPVVTDGTDGSVSPAAGTNWLANFQGLMADIDYITFPSTPAATTADEWPIEFALFCGPGEAPATYLCKQTLRYTWT